MPEPGVVIATLRLLPEKPAEIQIIGGIPDDQDGKPR
jgi:hypothetical protein